MRRSPALRRRESILGHVTRGVRRRRDRAACLRAVPAVLLGRHPPVAGQSPNDRPRHGLQRVAYIWIAQAISFARGRTGRARFPNNRLKPSRHISAAWSVGTERTHAVRRKATGKLRRPEVARRMSGAVRGTCSPVSLFGGSFRDSQGFRNNFLMSISVFPAHHGS